MQKIFLTLSFLIISTLASWSQVYYTDSLENVKIQASNLTYFEDPGGKLTINDVVSNARFMPIPGRGDVPNFGITSSAVWLRIEITNLTQFRMLTLRINQPIIDEISFFSHEKNKDQFSGMALGEYKPFRSRIYSTPEYLFDVSISPGTTQVCYLRIKCHENMQVPMVLGTRISTYNSSLRSHLASGIYIGIMVVMMLYNLFIYLIFRDKSYVLYSLYILSVLLTQTSLQGFTFQFLWPDTPVLSVYSQFFFPSIVGLIALEFFKEFLQLRKRMPFAHKFCAIFFVPYIIGPSLSLFGQYAVSFKIIDATASVVSIFMLVVAYMVLKRGFSEARFFFLGWFVFLVGVCIYVLKDFEILPYNNLTRYGMHIGSAAEVILLSFALAERINILKKEKEQSQAEALLISQQNQKLITEQNIILEQKVHERTVELEKTNEELSVTLSDLKDTQAQLVNAEKMASLGQLTAGIAHEINNPINFVSANLKPLKMDIDEVLDVVNQYEGIKEVQDIGVRLDEIEKFKRKIDLVYLKSEINTLLQAIEDGARRTAEIVSGLKNFSRLDESDIKEANINEGIESTLILLRSSIPRNTEVVLNLGDIPHIECYPGKLNQVFMNFLSNAIYAVGKNTARDSNRLTITTYEKDDRIYAKFEDTGIGMTQEVKEKVFEPFFTTKDVGEGTGLGMSIVFKIVESHHGKIQIDSEPGVGTCITLALNKRIHKGAEEQSSLTATANK